MSVPVWQGSTQYLPGAVVWPVPAGPQSVTQPGNASFESEGAGWTAAAFPAGTTNGWSYPSAVSAYAGNRVARYTRQAGQLGAYLVSDTVAAVVPGQRVRAQVYARLSGPYVADGSHIAQVLIQWLTKADAVISEIGSPFNLAAKTPDTYGQWRLIETPSWPAPANAAKARIRLAAFANTAGQLVDFDSVSWNLVTAPPVVTDLLFQAVQDGPGLSGAVEPVWPTVVGNTVQDNTVTWRAIAFVPDSVVWEANPIFKSGSVEPTWPTAQGGRVLDGSISWEAITRQITDPRCPQSKIVAIASSKVFAGDGDIVAYCATVNPLDWSTRDDAGYLPFGLQTYGSMPISALGLYRSNLVVFNAKGFQMWQVDEDPVNHALLDSAPVGCPYHKSVQPVSNDLVFLTEVGIRNIGIAGASANLRAGFFGKQVDPIVQDLVRQFGEPTTALYYAGTGQYWLIFGNEAVVLTMNGGREDMSWSRYTFLDPITDWTVLNDQLILRAGDLVWTLDEGLVEDDVVEITYEGDPYFGQSFGIPIEGYVAWPYLDFGQLGREKQMFGFDLVMDGEAEVSFGFAQENPALATPPYPVDGDTLTGQVIPMPLSGPSFQMRLNLFATEDKPWEVQAAALYINDMRGGT